VQGLSVPRWAEAVSFEVRAGEILGFAGLVGAGRTELFEAIVGLRPRSAGPHRAAGPRSAAAQPARGRGARPHLPQRGPQGQGPAPAVRSAREPDADGARALHKPLLDLLAERAALQRAVAAFGIRTGDPEARAGSLSGGNQQKLALARVLHPEPRVLVLDEPTRGVDVGAKRDIYFLIRRLADEGRAVVVVSSELIELIGLAQRVVVMRSGRTQATVEAEHLNEEELIAHATGTR
jgi:ribose transport system ATP-binding protein